MGNYYFLINSLEWWWAERATVNLAKKYKNAWKEVYIITLKSSNFYEIPDGVEIIPLSKVKNNFLMFLLIPRYTFKFKKN